MHLNLSFEPDVFVVQMGHEIAAGGLTIVDAIEKLISEWLEDAIIRCFGDRIVKVPNSTVHPTYYVNRFQNLATLSHTGYTTWYPEVRFSTGKNDFFNINQLRVSGFQIGIIRYGGGVERHFRHTVRELKTQVNHTIRLNEVRISPDVFARVIRVLEQHPDIHQPYIANLTVGIDEFVDDRIEGFRTVSFDHVVTGDRPYCVCHSSAHAAMLFDAR